MATKAHDRGLVQRTRATAPPSTKSLAENLHDMFAFGAERHAMTVRRARGEAWPWSDDPILTQYHFCNIFRELDKTLIWIRSWLQAHHGHPNLWLAACLARRLNYPPALDEVGFPLVWDPERVASVLRSRMADGVKTFNPNAYRMVSGKGTGDLVGRVVHGLLQPIWDARATWPLGHTSVRGLLEHLMTFDGWGPMISYQVVLDLVGTKIIPNPVDRTTWCHVGPGGVRGLNRIFGRPLETFMQDRRVVATSARLDEIAWLRDQHRHYWPRDFPPLLMCDTENVLCEYDKFCRIAEGATGQRLYRPGELLQARQQVKR